MNSRNGEILLREFLILKKLILLHMGSLNEWKGIRDDVIHLSNFIATNIINDCKLQNKKKSNITLGIFAENTFEIDVSKLLKGTDILKVNYIMYYSKTKEEYDHLVSIVDKKENSEADNENKSIKIISGFINGEVAYDFLSTISHEIEHLYQYDKGMEKRESLYDKAMSLLKLGRKNMDAYYVGLCLYYTFKHEQDAFTHEFYSYLMQELPDGSMEELLSKSRYSDMEKAYNVLLKVKDNDEVLKAINYIGFSQNEFMTFVKKRLRRLCSKMRNACMRYFLETSETNESVIQKLLKRERKRLEECRLYDTEIKWDFESIYQF